MCLGAQAGIWSCQTAWDLSRSSSTCGSQHFWRQVCALCSLGWSTLAAVELFLLRPGWLNKQGGYLEPFIHTKCSKHLELHIFITSIYLGSWLSEIPTATLDFKYVEGGHELKRWEPFFISSDQYLFCAGKYDTCRLLDSKYALQCLLGSVSSSILRTQVRLAFYSCKWGAFYSCNRGAFYSCNCRNDFLLTYNDKLYLTFGVKNERRHELVLAVLWY